MEVLSYQQNIDVPADFEPRFFEEDSGPEIQIIAEALETELRSAKSSQLSCGEVLLPPNLLNHIAADIYRSSQDEPCGIRGCTIYINFESENDQICRRIGMVKNDPSTVSTFELTLTLKQDPGSWVSTILRQFLRNFSRGNTILISALYTLEKKKLYRSYME